MKVAYASDLHTEFYNEVGMRRLKDIFTAAEDADLLILAGDIVNENTLHNDGVYFEVKDFFLGLVEKFGRVLVIPGNHEFYNSGLIKADKFLRHYFSKIEGVSYLANDAVDIDNVRFIGSTLWTDMNQGDSLVLHSAKSMLYDFSCIKQDNGIDRPLTPYDTTQLHKYACSYIRAAKKDHAKNVVITHHLPSYACIDQRYRDGNLTNFCFYSDMDEFVSGLGAEVWVHGHTHCQVDTTVGNTRVLCNPFGYPRENAERVVKYFEV